MKSSVSFVCGSSDQPLIYQTIGDALDQAVEQWGDQDAIVVRHQDIRWTYRKFGEAVDAFAAGLLGLGLKKGDRIGIWSPNNIEWVIAQFATAKGRFDPGQYQPGIPQGRTHLHTQQGGLQGADPGA